MGSIVIVGMGWTEGQLTLDATEAFRGAGRVLLHTDRCGGAAWLKRQGIAFESLDALYETCEDFDEHINLAAEAVLKAAGACDVVYGVLDVRDRTVAELASREAARVRVIAGPPAEGALLALAVGEAQTVEASDWEDCHFSAYANCLIRELDNRELAAELKLKLMGVYPEECEIWLLNGDAAPTKLPLYALDRCECYDHRTCVLVPAQRDVTKLERYDFDHFNDIIRFLMSPAGCPWDRVQTHETLRTCMLEEAYEVMDAIDEGDPAHLSEELGDMLLQIAMHAEYARLHGEFDISDVTTSIGEKMIHRHSHIFGRDHAGDPEQVIDLWNRNKMAERGQTTRTEVLRSVTRTLPALLRAVKVLKRSADVGLSEDDVKALARRLEMYIHALEGEAPDAEAALGDALLVLCGIARKRDIDPEIALNAAINRFIERFESVEKRVAAEGKRMDEVPADTMKNLYWDLVKL